MPGLVVASIIGAGASVAGAGIAAHAAGSAANKQQAAAAQAIAVQRAHDQQVQASLSPFMAPGAQAMGTLGNVMRPGPMMPPQAPMPQPGQAPPMMRPQPSAPPQGATPMNWYPGLPMSGR